MANDMYLGFEFITQSCTLVSMYNIFISVSKWSLMIIPCIIFQTRDILVVVTIISISLIKLQNMIIHFS